ncbi:MAG: diacylglycerol kinase family lipid kinase [Lachnospiraceae bacterium]|nr:diacylglycerol kinase family lipid kinase [Lachnospiraceae bacterium]
MYHIIINPASRSGKGESLWRNIVEPYLMEQRIEYISYFSHKPGEVAKLAAKITVEASSQAPRHIILLGGDGTFNEMLQGIQDFSAVKLGYIPTGSSNDLARDLGISKDPMKAIEQALHSGTAHQMDVGCVTFKDGTRRYFAVSCGMGFDAAVCEETNRSTFKKALNRIGLGKLAYLTIAVKQLLTAKSVSCQITLDNKKPFVIHKYLFLAGMLHRYEGGGFKFCPKAKPDDGIIDICTAATKLPKWVILLVLPTAFFGKHYLFPGIEPYQAHTLHLKASSPMWIHTDGEVLCFEDEITISCQKQALTIIH